jgi:hypothetical protein
MAGPELFVITEFECKLNISTILPKMQKMDIFPSLSDFLSFSLNSFSSFFLSLKISV